MKRVSTLLVWLVLLLPCLGHAQLGTAPAAEGQVLVRGYYRKDGTYVAPHYRAKRGQSTSVSRTGSLVLTPHAPRFTARTTGTAAVHRATRQARVKKLKPMRVQKLKPARTPPFKTPKPKKPLTYGAFKPKKLH